MARKQESVSRFRLALLRVTGWFCLVLWIVGLFYVVPWLAPTLLSRPSQEESLWFVPARAFQLLLFVIAPCALGFSLIELARVHERLNRQADDIEALGWRDKE